MRKWFDDFIQTILGIFIQKIIKNEFCNLILSQIQFSEIDLACMRLFGEEIFKQQGSIKIDNVKTLKTQITHLQTKIDKIMDTLINSLNQLVFQKLEIQISELDIEKNILQVKLEVTESKGQSETGLYHTALIRVLNFSKNLITTYKEGDSRIKMFIVRSVLASPVIYTKKTVYQTVTFSPFYRVFSELKFQNDTWCPRRDSNPHTKGVSS
jgi:hypothetical protein